MSTIKVDTIQNTSGVQKYVSSAWIAVSLQGTASIRNSGNVSSIIDNGEGDYTSNFSNALSTANHCITTGIGTWAPSDPGGLATSLYNSSGTVSSNPLLSTTLVRVEVGGQSGANRDMGYTSWQITV